MLRDSAPPFFQGQPRLRDCRESTAAGPRPPILPTHPNDAPQAAVAPVHIAVLKGAPEAVRLLLARVPDDYDSTYRRFAAQARLTVV